MPNTLKNVNSQNVLYIKMVDTNDENNLVTRKTKIQLNIQTIEQATPRINKLILYQFK